MAAKVLALDTFTKTFGRKIKAARRATGLSQVKAANELRVDYRHFQNIEGGKINMRLDMFLKLSEFFGIPVAGGDEEVSA